jgi:hypothetical protein
VAATPAAAASGSGKQHKLTDRSRKWPEVRRNDGPRSYSDGGYGGGSGYSGGSHSTKPILFSVHKKILSSDEEMSSIYYCISVIFFYFPRKKKFF